MANNDDFDDIDDIDVGGDGVATAPAAVDAKAGLKALWESNPFLKIGAVIVMAAGLFAAYSFFLGEGDDVVDQDSRISSENAGGVSIAPASQEVDPVYKRAIEEKNKQGADFAQVTGSSAIPTPIGSPNAGLIDVPDMSKRDDNDPLAEWRRAAEANRFASGQKEDLEEDTGPEVIPMVQPAAPQVQQQLDPQIGQALMEQMRMIISAQEPKDGKTTNVTTQKSRYIRMLEDQAKEEEQAKEDAARAATSDGSEASSASGAASDADEKNEVAIVSAGNVSYGQLMNELNSDVPGPVLVHVLSGPLAGGRAIGKFEMKDEYLVLEFKRIVKDGVSYKTDVVALDEKTTLTGLQSDVNHHYLSRIVLPAAAEFVTGMSEAASQTATATTTGSGGVTTTDSEKPSTNEQILKGVEKSASKVSEIINEKAKRPVTVKLKKGSTMGLLFMAPVKEADVEK